jgi:hypothetical protein
MQDIQRVTRGTWRVALRAEAAEREDDVARGIAPALSARKGSQPGRVTI